MAGLFILGIIKREDINLVCGYLRVKFAGLCKVVGELVLQYDASAVMYASE